MAQVGKPKTDVVSYINKSTKMADGWSLAIFYFYSALMQMKLYKQRAFTLIEVMIVVLILGARATIAIPRISGGAFNAGVNACKNNVDIINSQIELHYSNNNTWPLNIGEVINDPNYFPDGPPLCPYEKAYILVKTNGRNRVPDHLHLDRSKVKLITDAILNRN